MAIVEHKPERSDPKPLILGLSLLLLIVIGVSFVLWSMLRSPKPKQVKLSDEQAKQVTPGGPTAPGQTGPAFPATPALEQGTDPGATKITLDLKNVTVPEAIAALQKQSNVPLNSANRGNPGGIMAMLGAKRINLSVTDQPFWVAFRELMKQAELNTYMSWDNRSQIQLNPGRMSDLDNPTVVAGSALLVLKDVTSRFDADLVSAKPPGRSLNVHLTAFVEPKLNVFRIMPNARMETAVDEKGTSLIRPPNQYDDRNSGGGQRTNWTSDIDCKLNFPPNAGNKIAKLKGYVSVIASGKEETVKLKEPLNLKNHDQKVDTTMIRVVSVRKQGPNNYEGRFQADGTSPIFQDWNSFSKIVKLVDANGKEFGHGGGGWGGGQRVMEFTVYFNSGNGQSEPAELHITMPTQIREVRVPFEFNDLPLPH